MIIPKGLGLKHKIYLVKSQALDWEICIAPSIISDLNMGVILPHLLRAQNFESSIFLLPIGLTFYFKILDLL